MAAKVLPTNAIRGLVSKKKRRFQDKGFDLDLSYITDRIIAMGFPSESIEGIFRNPMSEVQRFLDSLHKDKYKVYNLCSERKYDHKKFKGRVFEFPFDDHNPCPLASIPIFCENVGQWLDSDPQNVAVIHCKAGKGRTGTVICCFLQYYGICRTASEALQLFAARRTLNCSGVTLHSQRRYVRYYESVLQGGMPPSVTLQLKKIRMHTIPNFLKGGGSEPWFSISSFGSTIYYSDPLKGKKGNQVVDFDCGNTTVTDDIKIEFFHRNLKGLMFYFWVHCSFIKDNYFCLRKRELEKACKDKQCKHFAPGFKVELFFQSLKQLEEGDNTSPIDKRESQLGSCCACNQKILPNQSTLALLTGIYHFECISCSKCGKQLKNSKNCIIKDGKATCDRCEGNEFFSKCSSCFRSLVDCAIIHIGDMAYHPDCFRCLFCQKMLDHKKTPPEHVIQHEKVYCLDHVGLSKFLCASKSCTYNINNSNYVSNRKSIANNEIVFALGRNWHATCFKCSECDRLLDPKLDEYIDKDSQPACKDHKPIICFTCEREIRDKLTMVSAFGEDWHENCFKCTENSCNKRWINLADIQENMEIKEGKLICKSHHLLTCFACQKRINRNDQLNIKGIFWHKSCFVCEVCHKIIRPGADQFSLSDDQFPICSSHQQICYFCNNPIRRNELLQFPSFESHRSCFICQLEGCGRPLNPNAFIEVNSYYYCTTHPHCTKCKEVIKNNDLYHNENGQFHNWCYTCDQCDSPLNDSCAFYDTQLLCGNCHPSPKCDMCKQIISEGHIAILNRHYHDQCFKCASCFTPFATIYESVFLSSDGKPICQNCCNVVRCYKCRQTIQSQIIEALGNSYHPECFSCAKCNKQLLKSFGLSQTNEIYCADCLETLRLPCCSACKLPLKGKYTIAGGMNFHSECFKCTSCSVPFGGGSVQYFRDGQNFYCENCSQSPNRSHYSNNPPSNTPQNHNQNVNNNNNNNVNNINQLPPNKNHMDPRTPSVTSTPMNNFNSPMRNHQVSHINDNNMPMQSRRLNAVPRQPSNPNQSAVPNQNQFLVSNPSQPTQPRLLNANQHRGLNPNQQPIQRNSNAPPERRPPNSSSINQRPPSDVGRHSNASQFPRQQPSNPNQLAVPNQNQPRVSNPNQQPIRRNSNAPPERRPSNASPN